MADVWETLGGAENARVGPRMDGDPPPNGPAPSNSYTSGECDFSPTSTMCRLAAILPSQSPVRNSSSLRTLTVLHACSDGASVLELCVIIWLSARLRDNIGLMGRRRWARVGCTESKRYGTCVETVTEADRTIDCAPVRKTHQR